MVLHEKTRIPKSLINTRIIALSFACAIIFGAILLTLPISSKDGQFTNFLDCLFTATSATCVTGLVVFDTFLKWSIFGQIVIIMLIQMGGLGIITFATFFSIAVGKKLGLRRAQIAQESLSNDEILDIGKLIKLVISFSLTVEAIGAIILSLAFIPKYGANGIYIGVFTAISAFCNAGFDVLGREGAYSSLVHYNNNPVILITVMLLIIVGGLGFVVWRDISQYKKTKRLILHTKVVLMMTVILIIVGTFAFLFFEWKNSLTMGNLPLEQKILASAFQSVTSRTAGFNSVDNVVLTDQSKLMTIFLMFIGAAPGSTGGGVKVTTFAVILFTALSVIKGNDVTTIMKHKISKSVVYKAITIIFLGAIVVFITTSIIYFTSKTRSMNYGLNCLFETVSAFGTVGLTAGVSAVASVPAKIALILTMFIGRVGPVSFVVAIAMRPIKHKTQVIPDGKIMVG